MNVTDQHAKLQKAIYQVIKNQLESDTPPETKETLNRLLAEGYSEQQAMDMIGHVIAAEVLGVLSEGRQYDEIRFITALNALPQLPVNIAHQEHTKQQNNTDQ